MGKYPYMPAGTSPKVIAWSETATDLGFIPPHDYDKPDIICHRNAKNAQASAKVKAGDTLKMQWSTYVHSIGPIVDYLAACTSESCTKIDKTTLKFFKISEMGWNNNDWAEALMVKNKFTWLVTIPPTLKPGEYVLRHEMIAGQGLGNPDGAQNYVQCVNLIVSGSGSLAPEGVLATSLYKPTDPGILFNPYGSDNAKYPIPGPKLIDGAAKNPNA